MLEARLGNSTRVMLCNLMLQSGTHVYGRASITRRAVSRKWLESHLSDQFHGVCFFRPSCYILRGGPIHFFSAVSFKVLERRVEITAVYVANPAFSISYTQCNREIPAQDEGAASDLLPAPPGFILCLHTILARRFQHCADGSGWKSHRIPLSQLSHSYRRLLRASAIQLRDGQCPENTVHLPKRRSQ